MAESCSWVVENLSDENIGKLVRQGCWTDFVGAMESNEEPSILAHEDDVVTGFLLGWISGRRSNG